jgi:hypothetical protein
VAEVSPPQDAHKYLKINNKTIQLELMIIFCGAIGGPASMGDS